MKIMIILYIVHDEKYNYIGSALIEQEDMMIRPDLHPWLSSLFIEKEYRNQGIASKLIKYILNDNNNNIYLWCTSKLVNFYRKIGFNDIDYIIDRNVFVMKYS